MCGKPSAEKTTPFCSPRCANLDLGRWLGEGYRIPDAENTEESASLPNKNRDEDEETP
jgi:endogenous inhibitor of DNA gyrase (YacG/DUF329 family)